MKIILERSYQTSSKLHLKKKKLFMAKVQWGYLGWNNSNWAQSKLLKKPNLTNEPMNY